MFNKKSFGERLNALRMAEGKTVEEVEQAIGLTAQNVKELETGGISASFDFLVKLSAYFNVSTDFLLGLTDIPPVKPRCVFKSAISRGRSILDTVMLSELTVTRTPASNSARIGCCSRLTAPFV